MHRVASRSALLLGLCAVLVLPAVVSVPTYATTPAFQPRDPGDWYLALGDSLAMGYEENANNDRQPGYPHFLTRYLRGIRPQLEVKSDLARVGETSASMTTDISTVSSQVTRAQEFIAEQRAQGRRVGLITLSIGMNDLIDVIRGQSDRTTALSDFKAKLEQICDTLLATLENRFGVREGDLILVALYNPYPGLEFPNRGKIADELVPAFNAIIKEVAAARDNLPVADAASMFAGNEPAFVYVKRPYPDLTDILDPDLPAKLDHHPRPAGHRALARSIMAATGYRYITNLPVVAR